MYARTLKSVDPWRFFTLALGISWFFWIWVILLDWNVWRFPAIFLLMHSEAFG